ncbi:MAG: MBL fold metallo-hydrolase [Candidatus Odinarchaeia archaeon]
MQVIPIAFDSLGVRSMATLVITSKLRVFIDPGVALGPRRYGLPPTEEEYLALKLSKERVIKKMKDADVVVVSHYHYDHHPALGDNELYAAFEGKLVYAKHTTKDVHRSARIRGSIFEKNVKEYCSELIYADGQDFGDIFFSPAVWHGEVGSKVGKVIMTGIREGDKIFVHGSDAQSLADPDAASWVVKVNPDFIILDGFPTLFVGWRMKQQSFKTASENLVNVLKKIRAENIILDHHLLRDIKYQEKIPELKTVNKNIQTAAEYLGVENFFLEAWRKKIHNKELKVDVTEFYKKLKDC